MGKKEEIKLLGFLDDNSLSDNIEINENDSLELLIKNYDYYKIVQSIYYKSFKELENNNELFFNGIYQGRVNDNLIEIYINSAVNTYSRINELNKLTGFTFKPFDEVLAYYVSTQFINYFNQRNLFEQESVLTFYNKMLPYIKEYKYHPFKKCKNDNYSVEEVSNLNYYLNDYIYLSQYSNKEICSKLKISLEDLLKIRSGEVEYNNDIIYSFFLSLKLSKYEIKQMINKISSFKGMNFESRRDKEIIDDIININIYSQDSTDVIELLNQNLVKKGYKPLNLNIKVNNNCNKSKSILLIGGFGFIGHKCIEYFNNLGYNVYVLVNRITKEIPDNVICYQGDITNKLLYERILSENQIDYIINLAAISTVSRCDESLSDTLMINVQAPNALYNTILDNKFPVKCVIFPSTVQVYEGMIDHNENCYEDSLIKSININKNYAFSKFQAEENALRYASKGLPIIITRLSNIYGKGDTNQRLIPNIIRCIERDEQSLLYVDLNDSNKSSSINLLYIEDLLIAFNKIFKIMDNNPILYDKFNPEKIIVNIANYEECTVKDVVVKIYELMGKDLNIKLLKTRINDNSKISVEKAYQLFNFRAEYDLNSGLLEIVNEEKNKILKRR